MSATHCDPEDPTNLLCTLTCGTNDPARQALYRRYMTGWFDYYLRCDPSYEPWVYGSFVQADLAASLITYDVQPGPPAPLSCAGLPAEVRPIYAVKSASDVALSWAPVTSGPPPVTGYRVYRSGDVHRGTAPTLIGSPSQPGYADGGGAAPGVSASYRVTATNANGEGP